MLSARQRSAFIMFDGAKPLEQVLAAVAAIGVNQTDVDYLVAQGFLIATGPAESPVRSKAPQGVDSGAVSEFGSEFESILMLTPQERYGIAYPMATQITATLGLRGFRLNLAVEAASGYDGLLALLPKIEEAVGPKVCRKLARVLRG